MSVNGGCVVLFRATVVLAIGPPGTRKFHSELFCGEGRGGAVGVLVGVGVNVGVGGAGVGVRVGVNVGVPVGFGGDVQELTATENVTRKSSD